METLCNFYDESATVEELENSFCVVTYDDGHSKTYDDYDAAIAALYKRGYRF